MSLEDQIRRMGDARVAEVSTPSWREVSGGGRGRWLVAAAAAVALIVGAVVVLSTGDRDDPDVDTANPEIDAYAENSIRRWIPADGEIETIEYGAFASLFTNSIGARHDAALITTLDDAADPEDSDWTTIDIKIPGLLGDDRELGPAVSGGVSYMVLLRSESHEEVTIRSVRFSPEELEAVRADLIDGENIEALAAIIAALDDDIDVAYAGPAASHDRSLTGPGGTLAWTDTESPAQFFATFPQVVVGGSDALSESFAQIDPPAATFDGDYFAWPDDPAPREIDVAEWNTLIEDTLRESATIRLFYAQTSLADAGPDFDVIGRATVTGGAEPGLDLVMDEPFAIRDGGVIVAEFSGEGPTIRLIFGPLDPGVEYSTIRLAARLSATEARLFADRINAYWSPVDEGPSSGRTCATNPEPSTEFLDAATHIAFDRNPLDLDLDGIDDEMLINENDDGTWSLIARLQTGWTEPLDIGRPSLPGLAVTPGGVPAGTDLDGDGGLEFFVTGYDDGTARLVSLVGCELRDEFADAESADGPDAPVDFLLGAPGGTDVSLLQTRITCANGVLTQEVFEWPSVPAIDGGWTWATVEIRLINRAIETLRFPVREGTPFIIPALAPSAATTGVIDCPPPGSADVDSSAPVRPECVGNPAPPSGARVVIARGTGGSGSIDVDQDGIADRIIAYNDEAGDRWLTIDLGDGYATPIPIYWRGSIFTANTNDPLAVTPDGQPASYDFDGDGNLEFFLTGFGNTARSVRIVSLADCALHTFGPTAAYGTEEASIETSFTILFGVGGNSCPYVGCRPRVTCVSGQLVTEITTPLTRWDPELTLADVEVLWTTTVYELRDGEFEIVNESETTFRADQRPANAPRGDDSDVVDCLP